MRNLIDGDTLRHRRLGHVARVRVRPYGILLVAEDGDHLKNVIYEWREEEALYRDWAAVVRLAAGEA